MNVCTAEHENQNTAAFKTWSLNIQLLKLINFNFIKTFLDFFLAIRNLMNWNSNRLLLFLIFYKQHNLKRLTF